MSSRISRRNFLTSTATAAGALALGCRDSWIAAPPPAQLGRAALVDPGASGIDHVIVFMMENRSFDHFLGWLPGADGRQAGLTYSDAAGASYSTFPLAPDFQGCGYQDPDHSYRWVGLHMVVGSGMVLSLFLLALVAVRSHARPGLVVLAIGWAFLVPIVGGVQTRLLPGPRHWLVQVLHLVISGAAIGLASALGSHIGRAAVAPGRNRSAELVT